MLQDFSSIRGFGIAEGKIKFNGRLETNYSYENFSPLLFFGLFQVLLLDEPTSALDPISTHHIEQSVLELKRSKGLTVIMVSHSLEQVKRIADYVCLIVAGELLEVFRPTELDSVTHPQAQEYLQAAQMH